MHGNSLTRGGHRSSPEFCKRYRFVELSENFNVPYPELLSIGCSLLFIPARDCPRYERTSNLNLSISQIQRHVSIFFYFRYYFLFLLFLGWFYYNQSSANDKEYSKNGNLSLSRSERAWPKTQHVLFNSLGLTKWVRKTCNISRTTNETLRDHLLRRESNFFHLVIYKYASRATETRVIWNFPFLRHTFDSELLLHLSVAISHSDNVLNVHY